jgi:hypothetical protein
MCVVDPTSMKAKGVEVLGRDVMEAVMFMDCAEVIPKCGLPLCRM